MRAVAKLVVGTPEGAGSAGPRHADGTFVRSLADLHEAAFQAAENLLWILHAGAAPADGALEALIDAGVTPAVSMALDASGAVIERLIGRFADADEDSLLSAVGSRQVLLRHTQLASMLVDRDTVLGSAPPDPEHFGPFAATEWTARMFSDHPGTLVTASRVVMPAPGGAALSQVLRMTRTGAWRRGEALREIYGAVRRQG